MINSVVVLFHKAHLHKSRCAFFVYLRITLILIVFLSFLPITAYSRDLMLAREYSDDVAVQGWLMSEKLDGIRGYWTGTQLLTKSGNVLQVPSFFYHNFPSFALEGEIWEGRGKFSHTVSIVKRKNAREGWRTLQFAIFDVPDAPGGFSSRLQQAKDWFTTHPSEFAFVIPQVFVESREQLHTELQRIEKAGGEGLIVRKSDGLYTTGRSREILKVKSSFDAEAIVVGHLTGTGRNAGRLGSLVVELQSDRAVRFRIGSGFTDLQRDNPPAAGTVISFRYFGFYASGIPKFPSFLRVREDDGL